MASIRRHWRRAAIAFALIIAGGAALAWLTPPVFVGESLLRIERPAPVAGGLDRSMMSPAAASPAAAVALLGDEAFFETQYGLLRSRSLAERVTSDLSLDRDDAFCAAMGDSAHASLAERRARVARLLRDHLRIAPIRGAHLAAIRFFSRDPIVAAKLANAFAGAFIAMDLERRAATSARALSFVDAQLTDAGRRLEASERALANEAGAAGIVPLPSGPGAEVAGAAPSLTAASLESLNGALAAAQAERVASEERWRQARAAGIAAPESQASLAVQQMLQDRAKLAAEYQDRLTVFKPDYPDMRPLKARLDETDRQLAAEVSVIVASLGARYQAALGVEQGLRSRINALTGELASLRQRGIGYAIQQRTAEGDRATFDALAQRAGALRIAAAEVPADMVIIDAARPSDRPVWPRPLLILALAAALGLAVGLGLALAAE